MQLIIKNFFDKFFAIFLLALLSPLFVFICILIKFTGPIFFLQPRLGKHGKVFTLIKFRTMIVDADNYLDAMGFPTKERVTRIGKFLRKSSLDEIPQLINIILGQMSFVGPRPALVSHWNKYTKEQKKRTKMLPGITGWAQVNGRNKILWSKRIELDIKYINEFSLWFDLIILLKTIKFLFQKKDILLDRDILEDDLGNDKNL